MNHWTMESNEKEDLQNDKFLETEISKILPNLPENRVTEVVNKLIELGVEVEEDVKYIQEDDLSQMLKPIEIRKLIKTWSHKVFEKNTRVIIKSPTKPSTPPPTDLRNTANVSPTISTISTQCSSDIQITSISSAAPTAIITQNVIASSSENPVQDNIPLITIKQEPNEEEEESFAKSVARDSQSEQASLESKSLTPLCLPNATNVTSSSNTTIQYQQKKVTTTSNIGILAYKPSSSSFNISFPRISSCYQTRTASPVILDPNWPDKLEVCFDSFPELAKALYHCERPAPTLRRTLVRIIADSIRCKTTTPRRHSVMTVVRKIVEKYPKSLSDVLCGDTIGRGYDSLLRQVTNRLENLSRCPSNYRQNHVPENREFRNLSFGCIQWQPALPVHETEDTQKIKQEQLQSLYLLGCEVFDQQIIRSLMADTYFTQRRNINDGDSITTIKNNWPFLLQKDGMLQHFNELMGFDLAAKVAEALANKGKNIMYYFMSRPTKNSTSFILSCTPTEMPNLNVIMQLVIDYFNDHQEEILINVDIVGITVSDVEQLENLPSSPCLIICGSSSFTAERFMLCIDKLVIIDDIKSFQEGFTLLFASFYCLNLYYPVPMGLTFEFFQRCFCSINPERGTRVKTFKGKRSSVNAKVLTLLNAIADLKHAQKAKPVATPSRVCISYSNANVSFLNDRISALENDKKMLTEKLLEKTRCLAFLTDEQIAVAGKPKDEAIKWSTEGIKLGLKLRSVLGNKGYEFLRSTGYPTPATAILDKHIEDFNLLNDLFPLLKAKVETLEDGSFILEVDDLAISSNISS